MGLRITQSSIFNQTERAISRGFEAGLKVREQISTGRRVNRPSDDPASFLRSLPLRRDLRTLQIDDDNASTVLDSMGAATSALEEALSLISRARETAIHAANGTTTPDERQTEAALVNELVQAMLAAANTTFGDRFLFAGSRTDAAPFAVRNTSDWNHVAYAGDQLRVDVEVAPGVRTSVNVPGDEIFMARRRGATELTGTTGLRNGTGTDSGIGFDTLTIQHTGYTGLPTGITAGATPATALGSLAFSITAGTPPAISVGGGPAVTFTTADTDLAITTSAGTVVHLNMSGYAGGSPSGTMVSTARMTLDAGQSWSAVDFTSANQTVLDTVTGGTLNVDTRNVTRTGDTLVKFAGTFDTFTTLIALRDALQNDAGLPPEQVRDRVGSLLSELDFARDSVLSSLQELGARQERVSLIRSRLGAIQIGAESSISREQDTDMAEAITRFNQTDLSYQAALNIGARILTVSLLNYLS